MPTADVIGGPVMASPQEIPQIQTLFNTLSQTQPGVKTRYYLADSDGNKLELPPTVFHALVVIASELAAGHSVSILHYDHELTTQQAADILQVSRPFLIRLLEQGHIPYHMVGSHRRVRLGHLLDYKKRRDNRRHELLQEVRRVSEALGLYDDNDSEAEH